MSNIAQKRTILFASASPEVRRPQSLVQEFPQHEVILLEKGEAAVETARRWIPDLVILDSKLADMDGSQACLLFRRLISTHLSVLLLTEPHSIVKQKDPGPIMGADDYLPRNSSEHDFLSRVRALLQVQQALNELHARLDADWHAYPVLRNLALTDHLTGVYNQFYLSEVLERESLLAIRYHTPLTGILLEIDKLQDISFQNGSTVADWAVQSVACLLRTTIRQEDLIARYDKEVFALLMPMIDRAAGMEMGERLRKLVERQKWESPAGPLPLTISLGVGSFAEDTMLSADEIWNNAKDALYRAKSAGGNKVETTS